MGSVKISKIKLNRHWQTLCYLFLLSTIFVFYRYCCVSSQTARMIRTLRTSSWRFVEWPGRIERSPLSWTRTLSAATSKIFFYFTINQSGLVLFILHKWYRCRYRSVIDRKFNLKGIFRKGWKTSKTSLKCNFLNCGFYCFGLFSVSKSKFLKIHF